MSVLGPTGPSEPSANHALDRTNYPGLPDAIADLWRGSTYTGGQSAEQDAATLGGIESIVNALADDDRGQYRVMLSGSIGTAATDIRSRQVAITTAALHDPRLSVMERIGVTSGMAMHEAGHTDALARAIARAIKSAFGEGNMLAHRLSNIGEDIRLERKTAEQRPAFGPVFPLTLWWVAQRYPNGGVHAVPASKAQAVNFALAATRYSLHTVWASDPDVLNERTWWEQWGERIGAIARPKDHVALITEALARMADLPDDLPQPEGEQPEQGQQGDEDGDEAMPGMGGGADEDEDPDEDPLSRGGADEADDESDETAGSEGEDADESDEDSDGESLQGDEAGSSGLGDDERADEPDTGAPSADDGSQTESASPEQGEQPEVDEGHVPEYHSTDGLDLDEQPTGGDESIEDEPQGGDTLYGPSGISGVGDETEMQGAEQVERDALNDPLPMHPQDAVTQDDRNRDVRVGRVLEQARTAALSGDEVMVTHEGRHEVAVAVKPLITKRASIKTTLDAQAALRSAFAQRRTSHDARNVARSGRLSGSRAYRARAGFDNVFTRRDSLSPDRLDLHLLIDASGSMAGWDSTSADYSVKLVDSASQLAATLTEALAALPTVRVHVWAHNTYTSTTVWDVYDSRSTDPVGRIGGIRASGGNNDASAIAAVASRIKAERGQRERSVLMVLSDGAPCEPQEWLFGAAEAARAEGIGVVSVAISGGLTKTQENCYGPDNVVVWAKDWERLARDMAQQIARLA